MYPTLDMKQKAKNARDVFRRVLPWKIFPAATGAANTRRFLAHCFGRMVITSGGIVPIVTGLHPIENRGDLLGHNGF